MFSQKSLRVRFSVQLASASAMLIVIFSTMLYHYIKITIFESVVQTLSQHAQNIANSDTIDETNLQFYYPRTGNEKIQVDIVSGNDVKKPKYITSQENDRYYLTLNYPYKEGKFIKLRVQTTIYHMIVEQILIDIVIINATMIFLIIFYALFLSRTLLMPVKILSNKLSKLNEKFLKPIDQSEVPTEFEPLIGSINQLIKRIGTFVLYQKELFIGAAHELKTPLAVMKTKNEVTLIKERPVEKYIEALKNSNDAINNMNKMISSILEIGRQEGAQFEEHEDREIIAYLSEICANFRVIAKGEKKDIGLNLNPKELKLKIQPNLFLHVIQNFIQNAIKFSPEGGNIDVCSDINEGNFVVEVKNYGGCIDESIDYFAPFKRYGNKQGSGLGLFLAKGAAEALGGSVELKNIEDGVVARFYLPIKINK